MMLKIYEYENLQLWVNHDMQENAILIDTFYAKSEILGAHDDCLFFEKVVEAILDEYEEVSQAEIETVLCLCIVDEDFSETLYTWIEDDGVLYVLERLGQ